MSKYTQLTYDITPVQTIAFYDIDKKDWRCFSITHFIGFVTVYELKEKSSKRENYAACNVID